MNTISIFEQEELNCLLRCFKSTQWACNGGKSRHSNRKFKINKLKESYDINCTYGEAPIMLDPKNLMECIDAFHKIIFQELIIQKQLIS